MADQLTREEQELEDLLKGIAEESTKISDTTFDENAQVVQNPIEQSQTINNDEPEDDDPEEDDTLIEVTVDQEGNEQLTPNQAKRRAKKEAALAREARYRTELEAMRLANQDLVEEQRRMREQLSTVTQTAQNFTSYQQRSQLQELRQVEAAIKTQLNQAIQNYDVSRQTELQQQLFQVTMDLRQAEQRGTPPAQQQPQQNTQYQPPAQQQPQQQNAYNHPSAVTQLQAFVNRPENSWINQEFTTAGTAASEDGRKVDEVVRKLTEDLGPYALRTKHFWDLAAVELKKELPHRYSAKYGQRTAPPVGGNNSQGSMRAPSQSTTTVKLTREQADILKEMDHMGLFKDSKDKLDFIKNEFLSGKKSSDVKRRG